MCVGVCAHAWRREAKCMCVCVCVCGGVGRGVGKCMERWRMDVVAQVVLSMDFYMCHGGLYLHVEGACVCTSYVRTDDMPNYK